MAHLLAAEEPPLLLFHISGRKHADHASVQAPKYDKGQSAIDSLSQREIEFLTATSDLVVARKNFFDLLRGELVPRDMEDVLIIPSRTPR